MTRSIQKGFTLIEILIVVIILGILAAIVIPQFSSASQDAKRSAAVTMLQTIRSQTELYKLEYGALPDATVIGQLDAGNWAGWTVQGKHPLKANTPVGPYLQETPKNPLVPTADQSLVNTVSIASLAVPASGDAAGVGFIFDTATGRFWMTERAAGATVNSLLNP